LTPGDPRHEVSKKEAVPRPEGGDW
jgi:hypothetical protein